MENQWWHIPFPCRINSALASSLLILALLFTVPSTSLAGSKTPYADSTSVKPALLDPRVPSDYLQTIREIIPNEATAESRGDKDAQIEWLDPKEANVEINPNELNKITRILREVQKTGRLLSKFDGNSLLQMPFAIEGQYGELSYSLGFNNVQLTPQYASMDVVASLYLPFLDDTLYFSAAGIKYNNRSGIIGDSRLMLVQDFPIEFNTNKSALIFRGWREQSMRGSYIDIDCNGVKSVKLDLQFTFNPDFIRPASPTQKRVNAYSSIDYAPEGGFIVSNLSITPFYYKDFTEVVFSLEDLNVDLSEDQSKNPYINKYLDQLKAKDLDPAISYAEWTGFYCRHFEMILGSKYISTKNGQPLRIKGENIVIDDLGFTAMVQAQDQFVDLDEANLAGWAISVDEFMMDILANQFNGFGFAGFVHVPILDKKSNTPRKITKTGAPSEEGSIATPRSSLRYGAQYLIDSNQLELSVQKMDTNDFDIPMFFANLEVREGSFIKYQSRDHKIEAYINGNISLNGKLSENADLTTSSVFFEGLYVSNHNPFLAVKLIRPSDGTKKSKLGNFDFSFKEISLTDFEPQKNLGQVKKLSFGELNLNLGSISEGDALSVTTTINVFFGVSSENHIQTWGGRGMDIDKFGFEGTLPGIEHVKGELAFLQEDPVYGNGFVGHGNVKFGFLDSDISMVCMFGTTGNDGYKYSYVDVASDFENPVGEKSFHVYHLMAGYHKNMRRKKLDKFEVGQYAKQQQQHQDIKPGGQFLDNRFVPDPDAKGLRGGLIAKAGDAAIMGLRVLYEQEQSEGQGIASRFLLEGLIEIMPDCEGQSCKITSAMSREKNPEDVQNTRAEEFIGSGSIGGYMRIQVLRDHTGQTLDAALGAHGKVGNIDFNFYGDYHKSPNDWHLFLGKPNNRLEVGYGGDLSDVISGSIYIHGYLMIGNSPGMPKVLPPPYSRNNDLISHLEEAYQMVAKDGQNNVYTTRASELSTGKSIAFGAGMGMEIELGVPKNDPFLLVNAGADLGFDLLMNKNSSSCTGSSTDHGLNGWYCIGQMYAGISASVGIRIKKKAIKIFGGQAAVVIQAGAFDPTYGIGSWLFAYELLWVKGKAQGIFKFGDPCQNITSSFDPSTILEDIYPSHQRTTVSRSDQQIVGINSDFRIDFALPADRFSVHTITDFENNSTESFEIELSKDIRLISEDGSTISGAILYANDGSTLIFRPHEMLRPSDQVSLHISADVFESKRPFTLDGKSFSIDTVVTYLVDPEGVFGLSTEDIAISYPVHNQQFFHKDEFDKMLVSFGKPLHLGNSTLESVLMKKENGRYVKVENNNLSISKDAFIQNTFKKLENSSHYRWIISLTQSGKSGTLCEIEFATSKYGRFSEKAKMVTVEPVSTSEIDTLSAIPLKLVCDEPLESVAGDEITAFLSDRLSSAGDDNNGKAGKKNIGTNTQIITGNNYLVRSISSFARDRSYNYFSKVYDDHIPYGKTNITSSCYIDDTPDAKKLADPGERVQRYSMFAFSGNVLRFDGTTALYDIRKTFLKDHSAFRQLLPDPPDHYAYCDQYSKGPIPYYLPGKYQLQLRYFVPGFEKYSSSISTIDFTLDP